MVPGVKRERERGGGGGYLKIKFLKILDKGGGTT